jgi:putative ABC transport system permease protein
MPLREALTPDTVACGEDLLIRLHLKVAMRCASAHRNFESRPLSVSEPDRMSGS